MIELKIKHKPILLKKLEIENELKNKEAESGPPREESYYINHADANSIYGTVIIGVTHRHVILHAPKAFVSSFRI